MKIAILLETNFSGGGSFTHSINACLNFKKYFTRDEIVVYTHIKQNFEILKKLKIPSILFPISFFDKILLKLSKYNFFRGLTKLLQIKTSLEKMLIKDKTDLCYFPVLSDTVFTFKHIKFVSTFLDLEHFRHSIFPEINKKEFIRRENLYFYSLKKSLRIIVSHEIIKQKVSKHYKISKDKIDIIPYTPSEIFKKKKNLKSIEKKFKHLKNNIFYPAQIWGHKNHISILKAAKILKKKGHNVNFIFSGRDRGYKNYLDKYIKENDLKNIYFTGFLHSDEMDYVYKKCKGVIFTSLFGPDAIPPLEAWNYKKPLIYNNRLEDDVKNGTAILIDVKNPNAISKAVILIINGKYNKKFINNGAKKLNLIKSNSKKSYIQLSKKLKLVINSFYNKSN